MEDETSKTIDKGKSCHLLAGKGKREKGKGINSSLSPCIAVAKAIRTLAKY
jgi:hypothetical protein